MSTKSMETPTLRSVVTISYKNLLPVEDNRYNFSDDESQLLPIIEQAFGNSVDALGIIAITDVPNFEVLRSKLLPLAREIALLPPSVLEKIIVPSAHFQVGWSHGNERVEGEHKFDTAKGSFYANPKSDDVLKSMLDRDYGKEEGKDSSKHNCVDVNELKEVAKDNPAFFAPNVWLSNELPGLETIFKEMGGLISNVGVLIGRICDAYVLDKCPEFEHGKFENIIRNSLCCKGRLLHYFPVDNQTDSSIGSSSKENSDEIIDTDFSDWCGWHNDHGSLTGLVPAMYLDNEGNEITCPDTSAGLYIKSRNGALIHVILPKNALLFQVGETMQIHSGGILQATPHAVKGCKSNDASVSRESFALFMEPEYHADMNIPSSKSIHDAQRADLDQFLPKSVRTLRSRWRPGMNFGEFSNATFSTFY